MKFTYYGHACFAVDVAGHRLLFDPFISGNPLAANIVLNAVAADFILLSHGHADHLADAVGIALRTGAKVIAGYEVSEWIKRQGITNVHGMNHGGGYTFDFGRAKFVNAVHSSMLPDGSYGGNPGGFVVESEAGNFYYSGDTALHYDMKIIGKRMHLDWAVLCIGDNVTMGPADAAVAAKWVGVDKVVGVHYDTYPPICIDHEAAVETFRKAGKDLLLPAIGETVDV